MRRCPFCSQGIREDVEKCPFCGELLDTVRRPKIKWYFSTAFVVIALLSVGPLALPLVWYHPRYKKTTKIVISITIIALTVLSYLVMKDMYVRFYDQLELLKIH